MKVFGIGFNKTGLTTLNGVFKILGLKTCPQAIYFNNRNLIHEFSQSKYNSFYKIIDKYEGFCDSPWNHGDFYQILDQRYPNAKFILTVRDPENWIQCYHRWNQQVKLDQRWFYQKISQSRYGFNDFLSHPDQMLEYYAQREEEIKQYFQDRPGKLLILNWESGENWEKICQFLEIDQIPSKPIPHLNQTKKDKQV